MVGLTTGKIYAYNLKIKDEKGNESVLTTPMEAWNWQTGGPMLTRPLPAENIVAFGSADGKAYVVDVRSRGLRSSGSRPAEPSAKAWRDTGPGPC